MTPGRRQHPLTRGELLEAALRIVDEEGLTALTMRRLADAVGVEAMSLYHHVPSKEVLLDWTLESIRSEMRLPDPLPEDWVDLMAAIFGEYRRVLVAHPNLLPLAGRRTSDVAASGLQFLLSQGVGPDDAIALYQSLLAFTVGYSMLSALGAQVDPPSLPAELAGQARDWKHETCDRTLRIIMEAYRPGAGAAASEAPGAAS